MVIGRKGRVIDGKWISGEWWWILEGLGSCVMHKYILQCSCYVLILTPTLTTLILNPDPNPEVRCGVK